MQLTEIQIAKLKVLLKEIHGLNYSDAEAQQAGMAIMRFVVAKSQRSNELIKN